MNDLAQVVFDSLCYCLSVPSNAVRQFFNRIFSSFYNQFNQRHIIERTDYFALFCTDVRVNQMAHGRFISLEVNIIGTCKFYLCSGMFIMTHFFQDVFSIGRCVSCFFHLICNCSIRSYKMWHLFVESKPFLFVALYLFFVFNVFSAEIPDIINGFFGHPDRFAKGTYALQCIIQQFFCFLKPVGEQSGNIFFVITLKCTWSVIVYRWFKTLEQVFVIDDVTVILIITIESVHPAYCLKETVVLHFLINVQVGCRRSIESGKQFINHNKKFQLTRFVYKGFLCFIFKNFRWFPVEHALINLIFLQFIGDALLIDTLSTYIVDGGNVRGNDGAFLQPGTLE